MNTEADTAKRIKINTAAIVDNINLSEGKYAPSVVDDYFDDLAGAIHELDALEIQRKWDARLIAKGVNHARR